MAFRGPSSLAFPSGRLSTKLETSKGRIHFAGLFFYHDAAIVDQAGSWYRRIQYPEEKRLGRDFEEDLYAPFRLIYTFLKGREAFFSASLENCKQIDFRSLIVREENRRTQSPLTLSSRFI